MGSGRITPGRLRLVAVAVAAVLIGVVVFLLLGNDEDEGQALTEVVRADVAELSELASEEGHPVYWAGPVGAETFEWSKTPDGRVYIRYLRGGAEIEDPRPDFLTVGTYPVGNGVAAIKRAAKLPGARTLHLRAGAVGLVNENLPTSVYLALPGSSYQVEVYDPDPARALRLVKSGRVQPVP